MIVTEAFDYFNLDMIKQNSSNKNTFAIFLFNLIIHFIL